MAKQKSFFEATISFQTITVRVSTTKGKKDAREKITEKINKKLASKYIDRKQFYLDKIQ